MDPIEKLASYFMKFPGVGRRQSRRFVYHLLETASREIDGFTAAIRELKVAMRECNSCHRFFAKTGKENLLCLRCTSPETDRSILMVVERDADLEAVAKSGVYRGRFFVLGGTLPFSDKNTTVVRTEALLKEARAGGELREIILALSATSEGEHTAAHVRTLLDDAARESQIAVTTLGRGLSTGTELEYSDRETIENALRGRTAQ